MHYHSLGLEKLKMKKTFIAGIAALSFTATAGLAGGPEAPMDPPVMAPVVVIEETQASSAPTPYLVLGVAFIAVLATTLSGN